jgi:hypothetical protein
VEKRQYGVFCTLKREAIALLKQGMEEAQVLCVLHQLLPGAKKTKARKSGSKKQTKTFCIYDCPSLVIIPVHTVSKRARRYVPV